ncbi:MAG: helix-turn-helix domain-containing protein [Alphaproteobacteria bacterium]
MNALNDKALYSVTEVIELVGIGRTMLYKEIRAGRLKIRKCGKRTLILATELNRWLESLPESLK